MPLPIPIPIPIPLPLPLTLLAGSLIALVWYNGRVAFFTVAALYCLSGPFLSLKLFMGRKRAPIIDTGDAPNITESLDLDEQSALDDLQEENEKFLQ